MKHGDKVEVQNPNGNQVQYQKRRDFPTDSRKYCYTLETEERRRAPSNSVDVCVCCATTGSPFISTLELRPLNLSMYATDFEDDFFLKVAARINFGAPTEDAVSGHVACPLDCDCERCRGACLPVIWLR
ncbi:LRR receptor-like kinase, partial [Trifolium medium]|nr:LRR receptor-like kinase [Trifolium medium]